MRKKKIVNTLIKELSLLYLICNITILKDMPRIISELSDLENMVTKSTFGDIYISALIGIFKKN